MTMQTQAGWWTCVVVGSLIWGAACAEEHAAPAPGSAIFAYGHGAFLAADGVEVTPTVEVMRETQRALIARLEPEVANASDARTLTTASTEDAAIADALYIDWLLTQYKPFDYGRIMAVNRALQGWYLRTQPQAAERPLEKTLDKLKASGMTAMLTTESSGERYVAECKAAGVPIPPPMFDKPWENEGTFTNEFISAGLEAELWSYDSTSPDGMCLALPRYDAKDTIPLFGVICLGRQSSKVCFWDNRRDAYGNPTPVLYRNQVVDIAKTFVGGAELVTNGGGECTDCHAGENPYIVHPDKAAFQSLPAHLPASWYDPLVSGAWRQNPGPTYVLDTVSSTSSCTSCHVQGYAGRFPNIAALSAYCGNVLSPATSGSTRTMPPGGGSISDYLAHVDKLKELCGVGVETGTTVPTDVKEDPSYVSPPQIVEPLYGCASKVAVRNSILDAKVTLLLNGTPVADKISAGPGNLEFDTPVLSVGDKVAAYQEIDGAVSAPSPEAIVRDYKIDYPSGLPEPTIDPALIYECAEIIAVRNVPGATLTVWTDSANDVSVISSTGWTGVWPGKRPFNVGYRFEATQKLCDETSPMSVPAYAVTAPATLNAPSFDPPVIYPGQALVNFSSLINGAWTSVFENTVGNIGQFTTPISWFPNFDVRPGLGRPIIYGDVITAGMALCDKSPTNETPPAGKCEEMPAPRIETPRAGDTFVIVSQSVPGARVRVYDSGGNEIGDGSGTIITLSRPLIAGETLTVTQQVGECTAREAFSIRVPRK